MYENDYEHLLTVSDAKTGGVGGTVRQGQAELSRKKKSDLLGFSLFLFSQFKIGLQRFFLFFVSNWNYSFTR